MEMYLYTLKVKSFHPHPDLLPSRERGISVISLTPQLSPLQGQVEEKVEPAGVKDRCRLPMEMNVAKCG